VQNTLSVHNLLHSLSLYQSIIYYSSTLPCPAVDPRSTSYLVRIILIRWVLDPGEDYIPNPRQRNQSWITQADYQVPNAQM